MNPHFIFNSLNSIQHLILEDKSRNTIEFISSFSKLMRLILDNSDRDFIGLQEEIELCRLYLEVEAQRLHEDFRYEIILDESLETEKHFVPTMVIQPFLENAVWHGLMPKKENRLLKLEFRRLENGLRVIVEDNGIGRKAAKAVKGQEIEGSTSHSTHIFGQRFTLLNQSFEGAPFHHSYEDLTDPKGKPLGTRLILEFPLLQNPIII